jgi:Alkylmercury lyase
MSRPPPGQIHAVEGFGGEHFVAQPAAEPLHTGVLPGSEGSCRMTDQGPHPAALGDLAVRLARLGPTLGGVSNRRAGLPGPLQELHRRLLGAFLTDLGLPDFTTLDHLAGELDLDPQAALAVLAAADLVHTDLATGAISVAYPFSGRPTRHLVELAGGPTLQAMCALDAMGIPQMVRRDARVSSADPTRGQLITVEVQGGAWRWQPTTTVLMVASTSSGGPCGVVADCSCPHINFHANPQAALAYLQAHPGMAGELLDQTQAVERAGRIFGGLLDPGTAHGPAGPASR